MGQPLMSVRPFQKVYLNLLYSYPRSSSGSISVIIIPDHFSKFHILELIRKLNAENLLENRVFHIFRVPEVVTTAKHVHFKSLFLSLLKNYGTHYDFLPFILRKLM